MEDILTYFHRYLNTRKRGNREIKEEKFLIVVDISREKLFIRLRDNFEKKISLRHCFIVTQNARRNGKGGKAFRRLF